ncbi:MAG: isoamylase early set domain-containing protein [Ginsengibacter sp.]
MKKNITFSLPAEALDGAREAILLGDFNDWNGDNAPRLVKQHDGTYSAVVQLEVGKTYHYRFLLDNTRWVNDYNAERYEAVAGLHIDNSVITVPGSVDEENKNEDVVKKAPKKKAAKADADEDTKATVAKAAKKVVSKAKPVKTESKKSVTAKTAEGKVSKAEKPTKAEKKITPKAD